VPTRAVLPTKTTHQDIRGLEKKTKNIEENKDYKRRDQESKP
jgi:hypothetical protein